MVNICKTGLTKYDPTTRQQVDDPKKMFGLCQWSHTVGQPIFAYAYAESGLGKFRHTTTWRLLMVAWAIILILADLNPVFWFDPITNMIFDIITVVFGLVLWGPFALIGLIEIIPDVMAPSLFSFVELFPFHILGTGLAIWWKRGAFAHQREAMFAFWHSNTPQTAKLRSIFTEEFKYYEAIFAPYNIAQFRSSAKKKQPKYNPYLQPSPTTPYPSPVQYVPPMVSQETYIQRKPAITRGSKSQHRLN